MRGYTLMRTTSQNGPAVIGPGTVQARACRLLKYGHPTAARVGLQYNSRTFTANTYASTTAEIAYQGFTMANTSYRTLLRPLMKTEAPKQAASFSQSPMFERGCRRLSRGSRAPEASTLGEALYLREGGDNNMGVRMLGCFRGVIMATIPLAIGSEVFLRYCWVMSSRYNWAAGTV